MYKPHLIILIILKCVIGVKGMEVDSFRIASQFHDSMACGPHPISDN